MVNSRFISLAEVREHATNIVAEFGAGYLYPRNSPTPGAACHYVRDGKPSCLIAQIMFRCGMSLEWMQYWENCGPDNLFEVEDMAGVTWSVESGELLHLLGEMQHLQDNGFTWGECVSRIPAE